MLRSLGVLISNYIYCPGTGKRPVNRGKKLKTEDSRSLYMRHIGPFIAQANFGIIRSLFSKWPTRDNKMAKI